MTNVVEKSIRCSKCGSMSTQTTVYSIDYSVGNMEDNAKLREHMQVCPHCNYTAKNIDFAIETLNIVPYKSVGDLVFGMTRQEVRDILGGCFQIPKSQYDICTCDSFNRILDCYYNDYEVLVGIIISDEITVTVNGLTVLPISEADFDKLFDDAVLEYDGESQTWVKSVGITSYNYDGRVSSLTVGTEDFFGL